MWATAEIVTIVPSPVCTFLFEMSIAGGPKGGGMAVTRILFLSAQMGRKTLGSSVPEYDFSNSEKMATNMSLWYGPYSARGGLDVTTLKSMITGSMAASWSMASLIMTGGMESLSEAMESSCCIPVRVGRRSEQRGWVRGRRRVGGKARVSGGLRSRCGPLAVRIARLFGEAFIGFFGETSAEPVWENLG